MTFDDLYQRYVPAIEAREARDRYFGTPESEPVYQWREPAHSWQVSVFFGPCSREEAHDLLHEILSAVANRHRASYSFEQVDGVAD
jgi:hypothetical protein